MPQLLHLVFGGELTDPQATEFRDVSAIDLVGIFPDYATASRRLEGEGARQRSTTPTCATSSPTCIGCRTPSSPGSPTEKLG